MRKWTGHSNYERGLTGMQCDRVKRPAPNSKTDGGDLVPVRLLPLAPKKVRPEIAPEEKPGAISFV